MTIAGSVYVASLVFLLAGIYCVRDLASFANAAQLQAYKTYVAVAVIALSYIFGFVAHRFIQIAIQLLKDKATGFKNFLTRVIGGSELTTRMHEEMTIWEMSPERIHREIDFQFAQLALLRSLAVSVLCLVASITVWRLRTDQSLWPIGYWMCMCVLYVILFLAFWRQFTQYELIRSNAVAVGDKHVGCLVPSLSPISGPGKTAVTITGINFGKTPGGNKVTFTGGGASPKTTQLTPAEWHPTWISVSVPADAVAGAGKFDITISGSSETCASFNMTFACQFTVSA